MVEKKDYKLFISLVLWALIPSIYLLFRMNIISVHGVDLNILGQMEWFDLIDEVITTTLLVPLYFMLKPESSSRYKNGTALICSFGIYLLFAIVISSYVGSIAAFMNAAYAERYLFLQTFSLLTAFVSTFMVILFTLNDDHLTIFILLILKILLLINFDFILIGKFSDAGASYSEILANSIVAIISISIAIFRKYLSFKKLDFSFVLDWIRIGLFSGVQIFLDNFIYAIMICKMVNAVSESGNYWVANNFIWGWLLVPVSCLTEIIKKNNLEKLTFKNTWRYGISIAILWVITMPGWSWFISNPMASDSQVILKIVYPSVIFYLTYIASSFIDGWFISKGKTIYNAFISLGVNIVYYGIVYILFNKGIFTVNISFVIYMFGFGMVAHLLLSIAFYIWEQRKMAKQYTQIDNQCVN